MIADKNLVVNSLSCNINGGLVPVDFGTLVTTVGTGLETGFEPGLKTGGADELLFVFFTRLAATLLAAVAVEFSMIVLNQNVDRAIIGDAVTLE